MEQRQNATEGRKRNTLTETFYGVTFPLNSKKVWPETESYLPQ